MTKRLFVLILLGIMLVSPFSCENNETNDALVCNVENPLEDLQWLKEIKQVEQLSMKPTGAQIIQYTYKGEYVFWVDLCYQCPDGLIMVYNCEGEVICEFGGIDGRNTCMDFDTEATDSTMLFYSIQN